MARTENTGAVARRSALVELPDGTHPEVKALRVVEWATLEEEALQAARRVWLKNQQDNRDLLPEIEELAQLRAAFSQIETAVLRADAACPKCGEAMPNPESIRPVAALSTLREALDTVALVQHFDQLSISTLPLDYFTDWLETLRGHTVCAWLGLRACEPGLTFDQVSERYAEHPVYIKIIANKVVSISMPSLGQNKSSASEPPSPNVAAPPPTQATGQTT